MNPCPIPRMTCAVAVVSTLAALATDIVGCSSASSAATQDGGDSGTGPLPYPAFRPSMPQIVKGGTIPPIAAPVIVPVWFSGDSQQAAVDADLATWTTSAEVQDLSEYGVAAAKMAAPIELTETAPASIDAPGIQSWLEAKLDGTHPEFGPVDTTTLASKIFVVFFPASTSITWYHLPLCGDGSYNAGLTLGTGAITNYVVVPECNPLAMGQSVTDLLMGLALSSIRMQATSPDPDLQAYPSAWEYFDAAHAAFGWLEAMNAGCDLASGTWTGSGGYPQSAVLNAGLNAEPAVWDRFWSNKAAAAYHDPCVPAPSGPYFVSVPVASDSVETSLPGMPPAMLSLKVMTTGVLVPLGSKKTIDVELLSDAPTDGPWTVSAQLAGPSGFTFSFDHTTGQNGDVLHLTIGAPSNPVADDVAIYSTLGERRTFWVLPVQSM